MANSNESRTFNFSVTPQSADAELNAELRSRPDWLTRHTLARVLAAEQGVACYELSAGAADALPALWSLIDESGDSPVVLHLDLQGDGGRIRERSGRRSDAATRIRRGATSR